MFAIFLIPLGARPGDEIKFFDDRVCKSYLMGLCPHELFNNTVSSFFSIFLNVFAHTSLFECENVSLWFNIILGLNFISSCFKLIIRHYYTPKQRGIKTKPRIKLIHNISHLFPLTIVVLNVSRVVLSCFQSDYVYKWIIWYTVLQTMCEFGSAQFNQTHNNNSAQYSVKWLYTI